MKIELGGYTSVAAHAGGTAFNDATRAVKIITFTGQPKNAETVTVDSHVFTFSDDSSVLAFEAPPRSFTGRYPGGHTRTIRIGDTIADTVENLLVSIKFCPPVNEKALVARGSTNQIINITYRKCGTDGNSYTVSEDATYVAVTTSAATNAGDARYSVARGFVAGSATTIALAIPKSIRGDGKASLEGGVCTEQKPSTIKSSASPGLTVTKTDTHGVTINVPTSIGGDAADVEVKITTGDDTGGAIDASNIIGVGASTGDLTTITSAVVDAINGTANDRVTFGADAAATGIEGVTASVMDGSAGTVKLEATLGGTDGDTITLADTGGSSWKVSATPLTGGGDGTISMTVQAGEYYPIVTCGCDKAITLVR
ncbi:hypothetical protein CL622_05755 [archaeon]|nr:hypothetical protein [archaeon]